jgi:hypothetical protein
MTKIKTTPVFTASLTRDLLDLDSGRTFRGVDGVRAGRPVFVITPVAAAWWKLPLSRRAQIAAARAAAAQPSTVREKWGHRMELV